MGDSHGSAREHSSWALCFIRRNVEASIHNSPSQTGWPKQCRPARSSWGGCLKIQYRQIQGDQAMLIAPDAQASTHALQSMQSSCLTSAFSATMEIAWEGQTSSQDLQALHLSLSMTAGMLGS